MNTILVPTDFSSTADNAVRYAIEIARKSKSKIVLFHAYQLPMTTSEIQLIVITQEELERESINRLNEEKTKLENAEGKEIKIETKVAEGFLVDVVEEVCKEIKADLIVMGITGASKVEEILFGSNTIGIVRHTNCPAIIVPHDATFKQINNIVFAADYQKIKDKRSFEQIRNYVRLFNATLHILYIDLPTELISSERAIEGIKLENELEDIKHEFHFLEHVDVSKGVNEYVDKVQAEMVMIIPRKHNLLERIFKSSQTKKLAFHSHVPMLCIHD
jgi:nucleotide-binding universal stress UspA family protein